MKNEKVILFLLMLIGCTQMEQTPKSPDGNIFRQLIESSKDIIVGKAIALEEAVSMESGVLEQVVRVVVVETIKGNLSNGEEVTFSVRSGNFLKDSTGQFMEQSSKMESGKIYILFLNPIHKKANLGETAELMDQWLGIHGYDPYLVHDIRRHLQ